MVFWHMMQNLMSFT